MNDLDAPAFLDQLLGIVRAVDDEEGTIYMIDPDGEAAIRGRLSRLGGIEATEEAAWDLLALAEVYAAGSPDAASTLVELAVEALARVEGRVTAQDGLTTERRQALAGLLGGPRRAEEPTPKGPVFSAIALRAQPKAQGSGRRRRGRRSAL